MEQAGFPTPPWFVVDRKTWFDKRNVQEILARADGDIGFPLVVKSPTQGSSIGVSVIHQPDAAKLADAIDKSLFVRRISIERWNTMDAKAQNEWIRTTCDIREGIGIPVRAGAAIIQHPDTLQKFINQAFPLALVNQCVY